jgi:hypothetical protein
MWGEWRLSSCLGCDFWPSVLCATARHRRHRVGGALMEIPRPVRNVRYEAAFPIRFHTGGRTKEIARGLATSRVMLVDPDFRRISSTAIWFSCGGCKGLLGDGRRAAGDCHCPAGAIDSFGGMPRSCCLIPTPNCGQRGNTEGVHTAVDPPF